MKEYYGLMAIGGAVAAAWSQVKSLLSHCSSFVFVRIQIFNDCAPAGRSFLCANLKRSPFGKKYYNSEDVFVRPERRYMKVGYECIGKETSMFWYHGWPIFVSFGSETENSPWGLHVTTFRWAINADQFVIDALEHFNKQKDKTKGRFKVIRKEGMAAMFKKGSGKDSTDKNSYNSAGGLKSDDSEGIANGDVRILKWADGDIGIEIQKGSAFDTLAFPPEVGTLIDEAKQWKQSEQWYQDKQIPWRRGWLLFGKPGTGKTSLVRAIAQDMDMPIFVFDLASMSNHDLFDAWREALEQSPAIVLMEDIDGVFSGRVNKLKDDGGGLTFDCLLNCISGIESANGVLLIITTNCINEIDAAIGIPRSDSKDDTMISTRPGRIDRVLELKSLSVSGRLKVAQRILSDCPHELDRAVSDGTGDTGAQFQERCAQIALKHYWDRK